MAVSRTVEARFRVRGAIDLPLTFGQLCIAGRTDPCVRVDRSTVWRAWRTPDGPATVCITQESANRLRATAWGAGRNAALAAVPELVGEDDDPPPLGAAHPLLGELERRLPGLRIGRTGAVFDAVVPTVLAQKVVGVEARRAWVSLVRAAAEPAPGPMPLFLPPHPRWVASAPSWAFHRWGVEHRRAATVKVAAGYAARLEEAGRLPLAKARARLEALPGIGVWTVNEVAMIALGDPDAVSVGDYWLKHIVSYALTGVPRSTDERMLELLEPWRGQRGRVCRLLLAGAPHPPRFGPRLSLQSIAER